MIIKPPARLITKTHLSMNVFAVSTFQAPYMKLYVSFIAELSP